MAERGTTTARAYYKDFPFVHAFVAGSAYANSLPADAFDLTAFFVTEGQDVIDAWSNAEQFFEELVSRQTSLVKGEFYSSSVDTQENWVIDIRRAQDWLFQLGYDCNVNYPAQGSAIEDFKIAEQEYLRSIGLDDLRYHALIKTIY
jgi:hypothetical protein